MTMVTAQTGPQKIGTEPETPAEAGLTARAVDWDNPRVAAILAAAAKCFARRGFSATTLAEIGKELGLRKSIVHYYFASKAALIHEVQSYSYHKYLDRVKEATRVSGEGPGHRMHSALRSLWDALHGSKTHIGLNVEVWSAARRDPELKRRASLLQRDARKLVAEGIGEVMGGNLQSVEPVSALILAVLNGLSVAEYLEGDDAKAKEAYDLFLYLLRLAIDQLEARRPAAT